jgi:hypothetical protein
MFTHGGGDSRFLRLFWYHTVMNKQLSQLLGLTANEAKILETMGHVPLSVAEIELKSKLAHASVVDTIERFIKRGLIQVVRSEKRKTYTFDASALSNLGRPPQLLRGQAVEIYEGKEDLLSLISKELLRHKHGRLLSFHGEAVAEGWLTILSPQEIKKRNDLMMEHDIIVERFVPERGYKRLFKKFPSEWQKTMVGRTHITHFLPDEYFQTKTELMMFSDVVMVYETHQERITLFRDTETVKLFANMFEMMRTVGVKVNSEEEFQKYLKE